MNTAREPGCRVFIACSVDGFIARDDGAIDWLEAANGRMPVGEDCGYQAFMASIDALVMGRQTFEQTLGFDPWPYAQTPVQVMSRRPLTVPPALAATVQVTGEAPRALTRRLAAQGLRRLYVDGGQLIQSFLREGLIDELTVTTIPVLLGRGRRLFGSLPGDVALQHLHTRSWPFGFVQSTWRVLPGSDANTT